MTPHCASQMRMALASIVWKTGSIWPSEREMTPSTSEVAVCCSSASLRSRVRACTSSNRRTFSMAITAWSAKMMISSISCCVNGSTAARVKKMEPIGDPSRISGAARALRKPPSF